MPIHLSPSVRRHLSLLGLSWLIVILLYHSSLGAQFNDDFIACIRTYLRLGPEGFLDSFDYPSFYYGHNVVFYGFYMLFGMNEWAWFIYTTLMHAINAWLLVVVIESVLEKHQFANSRIAAYATALFFIACPYQTETVTWAATVHYQATLIGLSVGILSIRRYAATGKLKYITLLYAIFAFLLVTLEESLVFPGIWIVFYVLYSGNLSKQTVSSAVKLFVVPLAAFIVVYFGATRIVKGTFVPHYGSAVHMANWTPKIILGCFTTYLMKLLGFVHFFSYPVRDKIYALTTHWKYLAIIWVPIVSILGYLFTTRFRREALVITLLGAFAFITLLPSLNMYFMHLMRVENDRLSFFTVPFVYLIPIFIVTRFKPYVWVPFTIIALVVMQHFLFICIGYWVNATEVQRRTLDTFHFEGKRKVFIVNMPVNFGGAYIYRSYWRFPAAMQVMRSKDIYKQLEVVAGQNMVNMSDGAEVRAIDSVTYDITITGGWFWNNVHNTDGKGDGYTYQAQDQHCTLHLDEPLASDETIIYQNGGNWIEVKRWMPLNQ